MTYVDRVFHAGDLVSYVSSFGNLRTVRVVERTADEFSGVSIDPVLADGLLAWGYVDQIVGVLHPDTERPGDDASPGCPSCYLRTGETIGMDWDADVEDYDCWVCAHLPAKEVVG